MLRQPTAERVGRGTRTRRAAGALLATALLVAACGSDDDDDGANKDSGSASSADTGTATGEPIRVMVAGTFEEPATGVELPEAPGAAHARAQAINDAGGIDGRPIEIIECNTAIDPNLTEQCARQAVDEKVVAAVGFNASTADSFIPILEEAGIPVIGPSPISPTSVQSPVAFPVWSGLLGVFAGLPIALEEQGARNQSFVVSDVGAATAAADAFLRWGADSAGAEVADTVLVPPDTSDFAAVSASALRGDTEGVNFFILGSGTGTLLKALRGADDDIPIVTGDGFLSRQLLDSLGDTAEGLLVLSGFHFDSDNGRLFQEDMAAYDDSLEVNDTSAEYWLPMWVLEQVLQDVDDPTAASVLEAMGKIEELDMGGMTPPLTTTAEVDLPGGPIAMPRMFNPTVVVYEIVDGARQELDPDEFIPVFGAEG